MNWNAKPENVTKPPPYSKSQSSILQQFLMTSTTSQSSFSYSPRNQEACMYSGNSNSVSQPLLSGRNYITPQTQISVSNMPSRTIVAPQSSVERVVSTNGKGLQQPNHNLQTVSSGVIQNVWLPSHTEATISHNPDGGTNMPYMHPPQNQLVTSDTCSMQLQMVPLHSGKVPMTHQGNQGLHHFIPDQLADWTQYAPNELTYPEYRPPPKQYSYILPATTSLQVRNNQLPTYTQSLQSKHSVPLSSQQYAAEASKRLSALPYSCRFGNQHVQNAQPVSKHLPMEVPQSSEVHSSEKRKDTYRGFKQQWQSPNEKVSIGQFSEVKINIKQSYSEPVRSSGDGVQALVQNNQEKRKYTYNPSTNQVIDTNATKEKLARDIKSLVEIKKKFSELARKIKINKSLLMAAGCSKTANTSYTEPIQHSDFSAKEMSAKNSNDCSMELLATCLSLWKNQPSKTTEENVPKSLEEKQCNTSRISTTAVGSSNPTSEVHVKSFCSSVGNSQKMMSSSQTVLPVLTLNCESSGVAVGKGTELQIAVVSPLVLSDTNTLPGKELVPEVLPETLYPVVKEGSVCSLQTQQTETVALPFDVIGAVAGNNVSAEISLPVHKEKQHKPTQGDPDIADSSLGKHTPLGAEVLPKPMDSTIVSVPMLQIESICSLAEGDVSYNSQIAEIFNSVQTEPQKPSPNQVINSQQEQIHDTTENKDISFQKDKCVQCTDIPHEVPEQPEALQPEEPTSCEYVEANREAIEENCREYTGRKESTAKEVCSPAAIQQDPHPRETDMFSSKSAHGLPAISEINDESEPISYLHDQLSELLKEFPYGIETVNRPEVSMDQQKTHKILENQTGGKTSNVSGDSTDQIKITILNSEQIKELFPEEDQPCDKLTEPENKEIVAEVKSPCDSQVPREESHDLGMLDPEKDKIHCCALGWLSMVYEGVPQCHCSSAEKKGKDQCLDINSSKQGEQPCNSGITIFEINPVSNNPKPLTQATEEGHFSAMHGEKTKASKTKDSREEQELACHFSAKCYKKGNFKIRHDSSLKMEQKLKNISSKCDIPNPSKSNKIATSEILHVTTSNSAKNTPFSKQASQESLQEKQTCQDLGPVKTPVELPSNTDLCRSEISSVQSVSPEKKKLKFKAGGSRLKYFEKRKTDRVIIPDVEIKKKKYEKQEQNKNAGDTLKLCSILTQSNERASVQEKTVPSPASSDSKGSSSKSTRVITVQEYLQRQKDKHVTGNNASRNTCVERVLCDSEHTKTSKRSAALSWGKSVEGQSVSAETLKELEHSSTSHGKDFKIQHSEASRTHSVSNNNKEKFDGKQPEKIYNNKTGISNESDQMPLQVKEQRKQYLNRVAFKCIERESICLTKLDSASRKLSTEKKSGTYTPKTKDIDKPSMLEFKLCPDVLLKNTSTVDKQDDPGSGPEKEQAPVQVSGIKSTKEDWLKCIPTRTKMPESSQRDNADLRLSKRSLSADEFETLQNPVKDSNVMFRTYKKMYLEKRSRSLGSSPVK
ncbi:retroelement silencing factor 1 [Mus pahari]|uniref:retroelement silencing factor 1 n=1 Tax=Mus pahari TaxID=10093 RepID=UPI000A3086CB|nr:retroelement silencing factor 1 [Mus pahari]XP_029390904.1 retroelement silencing factor 1 [Mus pahari]XP_029390905.1 retroelement silencing factor 1 [Mus pahari]XP_029390906.1 retroelement silencing factor 1 [Mus pahari]XP_029390907.1 retroelement silencing factor 1 [Mus pahari]XP_029390908.1 retroelement silencing factor 1 [Mus pahari]XP_029390909.1 retroelement silencing factor 1 [Mus pahari]